MKLRTAVSATLMALAAALSGWAWQHSLPSQMNLDLVAVPVESGALLVSRYEVSIADWQLCLDDGGCSFKPRPGLGAIGENFPVTGVNWFDVNEYVAWARQRSGLRLRLPTLAEWNTIAHKPAFDKRPKLFSDPRLAWAAGYDTSAAQPPRLKISGSFKPTREGVADIGGNVWEWTATCVSAGFAGGDAARCPAYMAAGEHEAVVPVFVRDPAAGGCALGTPPTHLGFRLVADE
jgi:formylglycine-generating enzyme required for sulfatase activity